MVKHKHIIPAACALALIVVGAAIYMAPSHREIALMQMDDFNFSTAFKNYSTLHSEGDTSINVLAPLVNLNVYYGDLDKAIALLKAYTEQHPRSVEARKRLAELYKSSQRFEHYCATLEELQKLQPSANTLRELADFYAFLGHNREEMKSLARLVETKGYQPKEADYYKLATLYRIDHQLDEAVTVLRDFIEDNRYHVSVELVFLAVQLLQESDKESRALNLAQAYLRKQPNENEAIVMSSMFEAHNYLDSAYAILEPFLENKPISTDLEQQQVDVMLEQRKDQEVYAMLSTQREKEGSLAPALAVTLTDLAVGRADFEMVETLIRSQELDKLPEEVLMRYADIAITLKRPDLAKLMQTKLTQDFLRSAPATQAVLNLAADDNAKNLATLIELPRQVILWPEAKMIIANIYFQHDLSQNAFALLEDLQIDEIFSAFDSAQFAQIYLDVNAAAKAEQMLNAARDSATPQMLETIDQMFVLLAVGQGKVDFVKEKIERATASDGDLWQTAYDFSVRYKHEDLTLLVADYLFKSTPTEANRLQLAEALAAVRRYPEGLKLLEPVVEKSAEGRLLYVDLISLWGMQNGSAWGLPEQQRQALNGAIKVITKLDMPIEDRRDLAFVLEEVGLNDQAEGLLVTLAAAQAFNTPDVENLLGFWEDHPSSTGMTWVENRARRSGSAELASWLLYLNDNNRPQTVVAIAEDRGELSPAVADQYIEALTEIHNKDKLDYALEEMIASESGLERVKQLATIAEDEDAPTAMEKGYRKVLALNPGDNDAAKAIGLIEFEAGRHEAAEPLLKQYVQSVQMPEYQVNMAYGEILQQSDRKSDAEPFFRQALQQISDIQDKDEPTQVEEAYLLYLTDHITESLNLYRQLLAKHPEDKELRADFAEILTETGKFDEATSLLSRP